MKKKRVLVIAGHDPSGAGSDADRAAIADMEVEGVFVVTARTDQDASGVRSIGARTANEWFAEALREIEGGVDAIKFGLLPGSDHILAAGELVRRACSRSRGVHIVVDPVLAASSGGRFLDAASVEELRGELCGLGVILTPNLAEAAELARLGVARLERSQRARAEAACLLLGLGLRAVIVKGGHGSEDPVRDYLADESGRFTWLEHARIPGGKIRGSGCRYATRLAAHLALGLPLEASARAAAEHVRHEIELHGTPGTT